MSDENGEGSEQDEEEASEEGSFFIKVVDENDDGVRNVKVRVDWGFGVSDEIVNTDEGGLAEFALLKSSITGNEYTVRGVYVLEEEVGGDFTPENGGVYPFPYPV